MLPHPDAFGKTGSREGAPMHPRTAVRISVAIFVIAAHHVVKRRRRSQRPAKGRFPAPRRVFTQSRPRTQRSYHFGHHSPAERPGSDGDSCLPTPERWSPPAETQILSADLPALPLPPFCTGDHRILMARPPGVVTHLADPPAIGILKLFDHRGVGAGVTDDSRPGAQATLAQSWSHGPRVKLIGF